MAGIHDAGPGVCLAGGRGPPPCSACSAPGRAAEGEKQPGLEGCTLIFANEAQADIIVHDELASMKGRRVQILCDTAEVG